MAEHQLKPTRHCIQLGDPMNHPHTQRDTRTNSRQTEAGVVVREGCCGEREGDIHASAGRCTKADRKASATDSTQSMQREGGEVLLRTQSECGLRAGGVSVSVPRGLGNNNNNKHIRIISISGWGLDQCVRVRMACGHHCCGAGSAVKPSR